MAKRKKTKKSKSSKSGLRLYTKKKKARRKIALQDIKIFLQVAALVAVLGAVGVGFVFLDQHNKRKAGLLTSRAKLELVDVPGWVNERLQDKIYAAATANGVDLTNNETAAKAVQQNISELVSWVSQVTVQTTHDKLVVSARWRRPIVMIKRGLQQFYVDDEMMVLDYVPISGLAVVEVTNLSGLPSPVYAGEALENRELASAVEIILRLGSMDELLAAKRGLLYEIKSINLGNFDGRISAEAPQIVFYATDGTEIIWGAPLGQWQRHFEATDEQKLAKLYGYYKEHGTILEGAKYINLREPGQAVPLPEDKY